MFVPAGTPGGHPFDQIIIIFNSYNCNIVIIVSIIDITIITHIIIIIIIIIISSISINTTNSITIISPLGNGCHHTYMTAACADVGLLSI